MAEWYTPAVMYAVLFVYGSFVLQIARLCPCPDHTTLDIKLNSRTLLDSQRDSSRNADYLSCHNDYRCRIYFPIFFSITTQVAVVGGVR